MRKALLTLLGSGLLLLFSHSGFAIHSAATFGPTQDSDRLWRVAIDTRPSPDVSPQQMMVALWRNNPSAFKNNNMNGLYSGIELQIPRYQQIVTTSSLEAENIVAQHNIVWQTGQSVMTGTEQTVIPRLTGPVTDAPSTTATTNTNTSSWTTTQSKTGVLTTQRKSTTASYIAEHPQLKIMQLQAHLELLSGQLRDFISATHNQMAVMDDDQIVVRKQLLAMAQSLQSLTDQVDQQKATIATLGSANRAEHFAWQQQLQSYVIIGGAVIAFLMVMLLITWIRMIKQPQEPEVSPKLNHTQSTDEDSELEDEYDFINSTEGIPAKLDLARAYIDMDDMKGAKQILLEVIKCGDNNHRKEAQQLLAHIELPEPVE